MITFAAVSATPGVASATSATPLKAGVTYYAIGKPVCKAPKQHHSTCFAERRVLVKKGTPGAHAFRVAARACRGRRPPGRRRRSARPEG